MTDARRRRTAIIGILFGVFAGALDATLVGTSMPTIVARLGGVSIYFLAFSVFLLTYVVSVPVFGRLSDLYGRRRLHLFGVLVFVAASMLCGLSRSMAQLVAFRGLQGAGAGCLVALSFTMIGDLYPLPGRAKMQGAIAGLWGLASLVGPVAGGWITHHWGWPWVFYVMVPMGLVSALLVQVAWRDLPPPVVRRVDFPGATLFILAAGTLLTALTFLGRGDRWNSPLLLGLWGATAGALVLLIHFERNAPSPFLAYDLFRIRLFASGAATGCCAMICLFATTSYIPLFVQGVLGESPMRAGLILVAMMAPWVLCSGVSGFLLLRFGYRVPAFVGMLLVTAGYGWIAQREAGWLGTALPLLLVGAGLGLTLPSLLMAAQNAVSTDRLGAATSLTQFTRTMGGAIGVAVMGALLAATLASEGPKGSIGPDAVVDPIVRSGLPPEMRNLWKRPLSEGLHRIFLLATAVAALGVVTSLLIPGGKVPSLPPRRSETSESPPAPASPGSEQA